MNFPFDLNYQLIPPRQLIGFLKAFDTGIKEVKYKKVESQEVNSFINFVIKKTKDNLSQSKLDKNNYESFKYKPEFLHDVYKGEQRSGSESFKLEEESIGTQKLYKILGTIYNVLKTGGTLIIDEINNSFHTHLSKFLIEIFQSKVTNKKNAQLIFTTHDTTLFEYELFRRDQIWFTEKDKYGATSLYSLAEFKNSNLRKGTPLEKWYLSGRFGALPIFNESLLLEQDAEVKKNKK